MTLTTPDTAADAGQWTLCTGCGGLRHTRRLGRNLGVCPECGRHEPVTAGQRLGQLFDPGSAEEIDLALPDDDPLCFTDLVPYADRLSQARRATGLREAAVSVRAAIGGHPVIATILDFRFLGGSLGTGVGALITGAAEVALAERTPLLLVSASGGARMQEGPLSLMQMAKTSGALARLDEAGLLTISLITDPTFGGVAASFASLCDVIIAEPGARLGFAGPRVIEQTIRQTLPPGFQQAESVLAAGFIDAIRPRAQLSQVLGRLLAAVGSTPGSSASGPPGDEAAPEEAATDVLIRDPDRLTRRPPWQVIRQARNLDRPTTWDYISMLLTGFEELHGDRVSGDCPAVVGGIGLLDGRPVVVIGTQKGHDAAELKTHGYGMPSPSGYRKAARLMRLAAKLGLPVLTIIDTPGAYPGVEAERSGQSSAIAENLRLMAGLPVPIVAVVIGEGGSGGALALAVADQVLACENAVYSVISAEGCAAILWKDAAAAPTAADALGLSAPDLLELGVIDGVIAEPPGGAESDHLLAAQRLRAAVRHAFGRLGGQDGTDLIRRRRERFAKFGAAPGAAADNDREAIR
jgi:acyl-CoA carboxylase subunit beta